MSETLLSLPEVARRLDVSLDEALALVERKAWPQAAVRTAASTSPRAT